MITAAAKAVGLDPTFVMAVVWEESGFNTDAFRFEPDYWNRYMKADPRFARLNPRRVSASYGLMQVMYTRLWEDHVPADQGFEPEELFKPEIGLRVGCAFLRELVDWACGIMVTDPSTIAQLSQITTPHTSAGFIALAAYNGGRGGNDPSKNWPLRNGAYARSVLAHISDLTPKIS